MLDADRPKPSFIQQLLRKSPIEDVADQKLDAALERLAQATRDNSDAVERVRRRQKSSDSLKIARGIPFDAE